MGLYGHPLITTNWSFYALSPIFETFIQKKNVGIFHSFRGPSIQPFVSGTKQDEFTFIDLSVFPE